MKKKFFKMLGVLFIVLGATACSDPIEDIHLPLGEEPQETTPISAIISPAEADDIANQAFAAYFDTEITTVSRSKSTTVHPVCSTLSRSDADTLAYIVNFGENDGYSIISAYRETENRMLAVVPVGHLENLDEIEIPAQKCYIETLIANEKQQSQIVKSRKDPSVITPVPEEKVEEVPMGGSSYGKLSGLAWSQDSYFGAYCDNGLCGCFATATIMVMAQLEDPKSMYINFANSTKPSITKTITPNWSNIKYYKGGGIQSLNKPSSASIEHMGLISRQIGKIANTIYHNPNPLTNQKESATYTDDALNALKTIFKGHSVDGYKDYDSENIKSLLNDGRKIMICGWKKDKNGNHTGGHIWNAEQYSIKYFQRKYYTRPNSFSEWQLISTTNVVQYDLYMNWGWNGLGNGYYGCLRATSFQPNGVSPYNPYTDLIYLSIK